MKKIFLFLNFIFLVSFFAYLFIYNNINTDFESKGFLTIDDIGNGFEVLNDYKSKDAVYLNEINYSYYFYLNAIVNNEELPYFSKKIKSGDVYLKGTIIDNFTIPYTLRIIKITKDTILVENLEKTFLNFSIFPNFKIYDYSNFDFLDLSNEIEDYNIKFNKETGLYDFSVRVFNEGNLLNSSMVYLSVKYHEKRDGLYVKDEYVFQDNIGFFVYKMFVMDKSKYYKKVYVNILDKYNGYYQVSGDLNGNNAIIKF